MVVQFTSNVAIDSKDVMQIGQVGEEVKTEDSEEKPWENAEGMNTLGKGGQKEGAGYVEGHITTLNALKRQG